MTHGEQAELARQLVDALPPVAAVCAHHADTAAAVACGGCGRLLCRACAAYEPVADALLCPACRAPARRRARRARGLTLLRHPLGYVVLLFAAALLAHACGLGRLDTASLACNDAGKPWFLRRTGLLWFRQAARAQKRAVMLRELARPDTAVRTWSCQAADAFGRAANAWRDADVLPLLLLAEAANRTRAGDAVAAEGLLTRAAREPPFAPGSRARPAWLHQLALARAAQGRAPEARAAWNAALSELATTAPALSVDRLVDELTRIAEGDLRESGLRSRIEAVCGTAPDPVTLRADIARAAAAASIDLTPAAGGPPPADGTLQRLPEGQSPGLHIERFPE